MPSFRAKRISKFQLFLLCRIFVSSVGVLGHSCQGLSNNVLVYAGEEIFSRSRWGRLGKIKYSRKAFLIPV